MKMVLGIHKTTINRFLIEKLSLWKGTSKFAQHQITDTELIIAMTLLDKLKEPKSPFKLS